MQARLLVTGGAGFIGSNFVRCWRPNNPDDMIVVLDALTYAGNKANLAEFESRPLFEFVHGDICDASLLERLFAKYLFNTVVHFAAETHVDRSIKRPDAFLKTNVLGTHHLLMASHAFWSANGNAHDQNRFHHVSTDEVYGSLQPDQAPFSESTPYSPNSPYAASKAAADHLVRSYAHTFGLPVTISNCSNNYGPYQHPEKLIPLCIFNALSGKKLPVYGDGRQRRDWLHVVDHCAAIERIIKQGKPGETYNIGGNEELDNLELVGLVCDELDAHLLKYSPLKKRFPNAAVYHGKISRDLISLVEDRPGHDRRYAIDAGKIRANLGFGPKMTLNIGLSQTVDWYLNAVDHWMAAIDSDFRSWTDLQYGQ